MAASDILGDPVCTMSFTGGGWDIPSRAEGKRIGVGRAGNYTCMIWSLP